MKRPMWVLMRMNSGDCWMYLRKNLENEEYMEKLNNHSKVQILVKHIIGVKEVVDGFINLCVKFDFHEGGVYEE